jgi:hypothetical protein
MYYQGDDQASLAHSIHIKKRRHTESCQREQIQRQTGDLFMKNFELEHDELEELTHHKRLSLSWDQSLGLWAANNIICLRACLLRRTSD